jgi:tetratricopeptide (TPR) repeat protein
MGEPQQGQNRKLLLAYAESSRDLALPLARALEAAAFEVVHSSSKQGPDEAALAAARTVLVCWTPAAVASDAVTLHAARARKAGKLASILLAPCTPPSSLGRQYQLADLSGWRGDSTDREFVELVHAIHARQSRRLFRTAPQWAARYMSWGSLGAVALGAVTIVANFGDVRQTIDGVFNPSASEAALRATDVKVEEVLTLLKQKSTEPLSADAEAALRESIERLLSAQSGARGNAARKLENGDVEGALTDLNIAAQEGEKAAAGLSQTWQEIGALHYPLNTMIAIKAYRRAVELTPRDSGARHQLGSLLVRIGHVDEAETMFQTLRMEAVQAGQDDLAAVALGHLAIIARTRGDLEAAKKNLMQALELDQTNGNLMGQANHLGELGEIARRQKDYAGAEKYLRKSDALYQQLGDRVSQGISASRLGAVARDRKRYDEAEALYTGALAIANEYGDREGQAYAFRGLGDIALDRGRFDEGFVAYRESYKAALELSANETSAALLVSLADMFEGSDETEFVRAVLEEAMLTYNEMGLTDKRDSLDARIRKLGPKPNSTTTAH